MIVREINQRIVYRMLVLVLGLMLAVSPGYSQQDGHDHGAHEHGANEAEQSESSAYEVDFSTHPKPQNIIPDKDMTELIFNVTHDGEPARNVTLSYRVYSPAENFWFSTDFPVVEGTQLLSGTVHPANGSQVISMILPIRGTYRIKTTVRGPNGLSNDSFSFHVNENPNEIMFLSIFLIALFGIGGIGGFIFSKTGIRQHSSSFLLGAGLSAALLTLASPSTVQAHGQGSWDPHNLEDRLGTSRVNEDARFDVHHFPQSPNVGEMVQIQYRVTMNETSEQHQEHDRNPQENEEQEHRDHAENQSHEDHDDHREHEKHEHGEHDSHKDHSSGHDEHLKRFMAESHFVHSEGGLEMVNQSSWFEGTEGSIHAHLFEGAPHYLLTRFYRPTERYRPRGSHGHGGHEHGEHGKDHNEQRTSQPWESEMILALQSGSHEVVFHRSGDPAMKWLMIPGDIEHPGDSARTRFKQCKSVEPESTIPADDTCYKLTLNSEGTKYTLEVKQEGQYRLFTQHLPREFDMNLRSNNGTVIEPERQFIPRKGELLGTSVDFIDLQGTAPPIDDQVKAMLTLLAVVGAGMFLGYNTPRWLA